VSEAQHPPLVPHSVPAPPLERVHVVLLVSSLETIFATVAVPKVPLVAAALRGAVPSGVVLGTRSAESATFSVDPAAASTAGLSVVPAVVAATVAVLSVAVPSDMTLGMRSTESATFSVDPGTESTAGLSLVVAATMVAVLKAPSVGALTVPSDMTLGTRSTESATFSVDPATSSRRRVDEVCLSSPCF
jgi:hypothetical protein